MIEQSSALEFLHHRRVVHGDIKTDNVLVTRDGRSKLADFGVARRTQTTLGGTASAQPSQGTFAYMAPELFNNGPTTERSDVYSLGMVLHELLSGENPFRANSPMVLTVTTGTRPAIPDSCGEQMKRLVQDMWSHEPASRPSSSQVHSRLIGLGISGHPGGRL
mmetsp:Transcript_28107/g.43873  ORF Transcript_28107/g.43873 Transcript_28107/m.43873 type:complete len:163 (-) Transcript_28107:409-897(-)